MLRLTIDKEDKELTPPCISCLSWVIRM